MVKIKDVANAAGVSTATVSRVLTNKPHVREEVRKRVQQVIKELNYRPNRVAQSLRANTSRVIALIVADIENSFFPKVSRAVDDAAQEHGYNVMVCNTNEDPKKEQRCLDMLLVEKVAGIILSPTRKGVKKFSKNSSFDIPMVMIDRHVSQLAVDNVLIDNIASAHTIVTHLLEHGYRNIAGIFGSESTTGLDRREGFLQAHRDFNITPDLDLIQFSDPKEDGGFNTAMHLLQRNRPDAIFTSNSLLAAGVLLAIRACKLTIPDDVALVSFDDTTWANLIDPGLTVIEQPTYEIGRTATELLIKKINNPSRANREVVLKTRMIVRESCGCKVREKNRNHYPG